MNLTRFQINIFLIMKNYSQNLTLKFYVFYLRKQTEEVLKNKSSCNCKGTIIIYKCDLICTAINSPIKKWRCFQYRLPFPPPLLSNSIPQINIGNSFSLSFHRLL